MPARLLFNLEDVKSGTASRRPLSCISCGLYKDAKTPRMAPFGQGRKRVLLIGEGPGADEDEEGRPWIGKAGGVLSRVLRELGFDLARDCVSLNSVNCRPPKNRAPTPHEVACCRTKIVQPTLDRHSRGPSGLRAGETKIGSAYNSAKNENTALGTQEIGSTVVLLLGGTAVSSVLGPLHPSAEKPSIGLWRGWTIPYPEKGFWICPTYHPSYINREENHLHVVPTVWRFDLRQALAKLREPVPPHEDLRTKVTILRDKDRILSRIRALHRCEYFAYDYETTSLRPLSPDHRILSISFSSSEDRAYSFRYSGDPDIQQAWHDVLADDQVGKVAHNIKFEQLWSCVAFGLERIRWAWDSMLGAHTLDNRPGICSLKFQAFVQFGVPSYDNLISPYLKPSDPKNPNSLNRILEFISTYGEDEELIYNGLDSLLNYKLTKRQRETILGPSQGLSTASGRSLRT